ncbi:DUF5681 domain-containing protein [Sphingomonas sp. GC_Shp_3]|uniref:DUF5681 domain-containing protein n=1 Tax=Sphingomonas sp. GC_Shp_3 TaxID=2937383 RepID=UPI00226A835A
MADNKIERADSEPSEVGENEERVGYRRPPRQHQFKPGRSGNPRGRPQGAKGLKSELLAVINEQLTITVNGKPRRMRTLRVVLKSLAAQAAKGKIAAADKLLTLVIDAFGFEDERTTARELSDTDRLIIQHMLGQTTGTGGAGDE